MSSTLYEWNENNTFDRQTITQEGFDNFLDQYNYN